MKETIRSRLQKKDIFTIPNQLSLLRLLLIPAIVILYLNGHTYLSVAIILLSALTDVVDGWIARRFHMVSDFGKFLDPVADKLTQIAMLSCVVIQYSRAILLIALLIVKDLFQFIFGLIILKKTNTMNSAKWFGKVNTIVIYSAMILLFLFTEMPSALSQTLLAACAITMLSSMLLYGRFFRRILKQTKKNPSEASLQEEFQVPKEL